MRGSHPLALCRQSRSVPRQGRLSRLHHARPHTETASQLSARSRIDSSPATANGQRTLHWAQLQEMDLGRFPYGSPVPRLMDFRKASPSRLPERLRHLGVAGGSHVPLSGATFNPVLREPRRQCPRLGHEASFAHLLPRCQRPGCGRLLRQGSLPGARTALVLREQRHSMPSTDRGRLPRYHCCLRLSSLLLGTVAAPEQIPKLVDAA